MNVSKMWFLKIVLKCLLSRLPVPYLWWQSLGLFRHGDMDSAKYAFKIFNLHWCRAFPKGIPKGLVVLELGPGDSIASAIIAASYGAAKVYLVDVGRYATKDISYYKTLVAAIKVKGLDIPNLENVTTIDDILEVCNAEYLTDGLNSLKSLKSGSVDLVWSHSVLEHVRKHQFDESLFELTRVLKEGGLSSHNIDFQDHLSRGLNNLRFSEKVWESSFFVNSGFYTNRIPAAEMHCLFRDVGYQVLKEGFGKWPTLPISRVSLSDEFQNYTDDELLNRTSHVLLRKVSV